MAQGGGKVANRLVAGSFAAVLAVYTAGYARTQSAANRLATQVAERRASVPARERVVFQGPARPSAPIPARFLPPAAERTRDVIPRAKVEPAHEGGQAEAKVNALTSLPEHARSETLDLPAPVVQAMAPAPVVAIAPAPAIPPVPAPVPAPAKPTWKDGTYTGWGYSRHGNIEAAVVIEGGRILSASITQCRTRYSCDVIDRIIPQVAQRQGPEVDYVSGATESADAFYGAVFEALGKAK